MIIGFNIFAYFNKIKKIHDISSFHLTNYIIRSNFATRKMGALWVKISSCTCPDIVNKTHSSQSLLYIIRKTNHYVIFPHYFNWVIRFRSFPDKIESENFKISYRLFSIYLYATTGEIKNHEFCSRLNTHLLIVQSTFTI